MTQRDTRNHPHTVPVVAVIGGGPAGLMAAEVLAQGGMQVNVYDAMPSVGRKFLMAGKGGMNITHAEAFGDFLARYGARRSYIEPLLRSFPPEALREWIHGLGIATFVGTSGRVFPTGMKAAPLLRAWLHRLRGSGVHFHARHRWCGWDEQGALRFEIVQSSGTVPHPSPDGTTSHSTRLSKDDNQVAGYLPMPSPQSSPASGRGGEREEQLSILAGEGANVKSISSDAVVLALGGGSWPQLGSDGAWVSLLAQRGIAIAPLRPANCGFDVRWSAHFRERFAGEPLKSIAAAFHEVRKQGECVITEHGIEGGLIYALSAALRDEIDHSGHATLHLDLLPDLSLRRVQDEASHPRGSRSLSSHLQSRLGLKGVKANLLREALTAEQMHDTALLARTIKALPLRLAAARPLVEAISSAGGVTFEALDERLMLKKMPGVFCAGEMLDWEAPTGGYLLTACFASGHAAGKSVIDWLQQPRAGHG